MNRSTITALVLGGIVIAGAATGGTALAMAGHSAPAASVTHQAPASPAPSKTIIITRPAQPQAPSVTINNNVPAPAVPADPPAPVAPAPAPQLTNGSAIVLQYYQDITDHNYSAAWALGGDNIGGSSYSGWVAGYGTTASISVTAYGTYSDGTVWTTISAVQDNGTVYTYSGTYTVANGVIVSANISQTS